MEAEASVKSPEIINKIETVKNVAADILNIPYTKIDSLSKTMLALSDIDTELGGRSGLNSDGSPIQFCISSKKESSTGRFITDPAFAYGDIKNRYEKSLEAIQSLFVSKNAQELAPFFNEMLAFYLPENKSLEAYPDGVFWLGAPVNLEGIAIYMDGRRDGNVIAWQRTHKWLLKIMPTIKHVNPWIDAMIQYGDIMSVGFEGSNLKNVRAKIYFRLKEPVLLDALGCDILKHQEFKTFLSEIVEEKEMDLFGMVFSVGFHVASQQFFDAKIDMCGCPNCLSFSATKWIEKLDHFTDTYNLTPFPVTRELLEESTAVSYVGFGLDIRGDKRLNLYLKGNE